MELASTPSANWPSLLLEGRTVDLNGPWTPSPNCKGLCVCPPPPVYPPHLPCPNQAFLPSSQEALTILRTSSWKVLGQPGRSLARSCLGQLGVLA